MYIPRIALNLVDKKMKDGFPYHLALFSVSDRFDLDMTELRQAHERRSRIGELIDDGLLAVGMVAVFAFPVIFYFFAKG